MLVKRKDRLSGLFDPYSDGDDVHSPWRDDDQFADAAENSAVRPVPSSATPPPVPTAKSQPTQRGLGIPPPPTEEEAAAFTHLPTLTSAAPLSLDAFDEDAAPKASDESDGRAPQAELSENERITVRAPAKEASSSRPRRRRFYALAILFGTGSMLALMLRHRTAPAEHIADRALRPPSQLRLVATAPAVEEPAVEGSVHVDGERNGATPSNAEASTAEVVHTAATPSRRSGRKPASTHDRQTRAAPSRDERHGETKAAPSRDERHGEKPAPSSTRDAVANVASGLDVPSVGATEDAPARRILSLPPR
jgi:hypothetical protein